MKKNITAVIELASGELRLKIGEKKGDGIKITEGLSYPLSLGKDTFHTGKISFETMYKTAEIINGFLQVAKEYGVEKLSTIATTAVREAANKDYVSDQIKIKTGVDITIIDDSKEKNLINTLMLSLLPQKYTASAAVIHLGSGNISVSLLEDSLLTDTMIIKTGGLRLSEMFDVVGEDKYPEVVREYLRPYVDGIMNILPESLSAVIITGSDADLISALCGGKPQADVTEIGKQNFSSFYKQTKEKSPAAIEEKFGVSHEKQEILTPALIICNRILKNTSAEKIIALPITAGESLILKMLNPTRFAELNRRLEQSALISAWKIAARYGADSDHTKKVETCALMLFDKLKKLHGLGKRRRFLMQMTAILHNIGKFINPKSHCTHSYNIIKGLDIAGLDDNEKRIIAAAALFHGSVLPDMKYDEYSSLSPEARSVVSKLCAILRLAVAINSGYGDKYDGVTIKLKGNKLTVTLLTYKNIELEKLIFATKAELFTDVFGIKPILAKRSVI